MSISIDGLSAAHIDVLREIGNIGAGNAATALAKLLNKRVNMAVPKVQILEFKSLTDVLGGPENLVVGILIGVTGNINGYIMFLLEQQYAHTLVNMLMERDLSDISEFTEMDVSALKEIGNILAGSYISALSNLTNLDILPSIPDMAMDMAGAIMSFPAIEFGKIGDTVLFIETEFIDKDYSVVGNFFLIPDLESYDTLLRVLGVVD